MSAPEVAKLGTIEALKDQVLMDIEKDLVAYLKNAQTAAWNADDKMHSSFTTTVSIKLKTVAEEQTIGLEINSRERIPKPVIKHAMEFNKGKQLVLL